MITADRINAATVIVSPYAQSAAGRIVPLAQTAANRPYVSRVCPPARVERRREASESRARRLGLAGDRRR